MSYLIKNAARKLADIATQKMYEVFLEKMIERGYDETNVKKIGGEIVFEVDESERTGYEIEAVKAETFEELMEKRIDGEIDKPKYKYDEDFVSETERDLPPDDYNKMILPGTKVSIDALKEWVLETKVNSDPVLQAAVSADFLSPRIRNKNNPNYKDQEWESSLDRTVDRIAYKVARKIYYVGRKPSYMEPEEWDIFIEGKKPVPGTYSKNETWGDREFPYGNEYKYRMGPAEDTFHGGTTDPIYKGWTRAGMGEI